MQFVLATFLTLVAATAARPGREDPKNVVTQHSVKNLSELQNKCGDMTINCCVNIPEDDHSKKFQGLGGLLDELLAGDVRQYCSPAHSSGVIPIDLANLLGTQEDHICDIPNVTYACCTDGKCDNIGPLNEGNE
ncbi:hypothetical protein BDW72DRAFT_191665 [Aspergillus terricola var. indicus]